MAIEKVLNTRIQLKYDSYANWSTKNPTLKSGEVAIAYLTTSEVIQPGSGDAQHPVMFKVGPGAFNSLPWSSALAADVHAWAKKSESEFTAWVKGLVSPSDIDAYSKGEVDSMLSANSTADQKYAKDYADSLAKNYEPVGKAQELINTLDVEDTAITGQYVSAVSEVDGKIVVSRANLPVDTLATGSENGTVAFNGADVAVKGLGSAAYTDAKAYDVAGAADAVNTALENYKTTNDAAVNAEKSRAEGAEAGLQAAINAINNADTGILKQAKNYADGKDGAIANAQKAGDDAMAEAQKKVASVTAANASVTVGGTSTAPTVAAKLSADADNALTLAEDGLKVVIPAAAEYSIVKDENAGDYAAVYHLTKGGVNVGAAINIPKDMVVKSGKVENGNIVLVLNDEANTEITIPAASLIEYVTSGSATGDMVVINIDDEHKVTASITDGSITLAKLHTDIQTAIGKAHTHGNADVLAGINADMVAAWNAAEQNARDHADDLDEAMNVRVEALEAIDHSHANAEVLNGISAEKVAAWDAAEDNAKAYADEQVAKSKIVVVTATENDGIASMTSAEIAAAVQNGNDVSFIANGVGLRLIRIVNNIAYFGANINTAGSNDFPGKFKYWEIAIDADGKYTHDFVEIATSKDVNEKIGEVTEGKTVVEMISDAQEAAEQNAKVDAANKDAVVLAEAQKGIAAVEAEVAKKTNDADLAAVAKSGLIDDLSIGEGTVLIFDCGGAE